MKSRYMPIAATLVLAFGLYGPVEQSQAAHHLGPLEAALQNPSRSDADKARDAGRKPAEVLNFLGIGDGMTVLDLMASTGYYTEVLSLAVGETGKVYAQNPPSFLQWNDGLYDKALTERLANDRLANVERLNANLADTGLAEGSLDAAFTALNFHDIYNGNPDAGLQALKDLLPLLKPGGILGMIDHRGDADADNAKMHRMNLDLAIAAAEQAGFELAGQSDILTNSDDDHTKGVFDPAVRGKTDRFLVKFTKPE